MVEKPELLASATQSYRDPARIVGLSASPEPCIFIQINLSQSPNAFLLPQISTLPTSYHFPQMAIPTHATTAPQDLSQFEKDIKDVHLIYDYAAKDSQGNPEKWRYEMSIPSLSIYPSLLISVTISPFNVLFLPNQVVLLLRRYRLRHPQQPHG
jgi:hypothetical protein